jgi:TolB-like protein/tRNA A-37 threonylcarbamoyl transferase component Bud32/Tfp pilus assembly protein PilF
MIGKTISHYKILEKLGEGGMGVVYKAEDTKLKRVVALKFLHPELTRDDDAKARFVHEAQAAASLNHPNICTVYEIDEYEGQSFIAIEFLEGKELKDRIAKGPLPIDDALSIVTAVGEGLREAHEKGIVHRDVKPGNIMLTTRGQAKLLDFGLARLGELSKITKTDTTLGTAAYMSPEQASSKEVDRRTDIWSLGVILYELVAGDRPFTGQYEAAVVHSILHDEPEPLTSRRSNVPLELERVVQKALAKNASERYPHVEDMLVDLRALQSSVGTGRVHPEVARRSIGRQAFIVGAVIVAAAAIAFFAIQRLRAPGAPPPDEASMEHRKMIAVLPFENLGAPEDEYFANGTTDAITARLAGVSGLGVIARQSAIQYKNTTKPIRQIGKELGVDYILEGTVQREKPGDPTSRVRVIPQLVRVSDETNVWAETYDESMAEVFRVQSDIAERVAARLDVTLLDPERRALEKRPTENLAAYEAYLQGLSSYDRRSIADAEISVQRFQKAVSLDPRFAEAWAWLALAYEDLYWGYDRPGTLALETEAAKRAEELAPDLPETHLALGNVAYANREFDRALVHFERAYQLRPGGDASKFIGFTLRRMGKWQEALNHFEAARALQPHDFNLYMDGLGFTLASMRRFDEGEQAEDQAILIAADLSFAYLFKAHIRIARNGDVGGAKQAMQEMSRRANLSEAAESEVGQGLEFTTELRVLPETWSAVFDAFEAGRIEYFRKLQPAMIASTHLSRAMIIDVEKGRPSAAARYDSARVCYERIIRSNPQSAYVALYHAGLGVAYAGLGRKADAIHEGEQALEMIPLSKDAVVGEQLLRYLSEIYVMCGEYEKAIDKIEILRSVPGYVTPASLRVDPLWNPIRDNPRFRRLVEGR